MKYLLLGDPHVCKANLDESARLMKWVISMLDRDTRLIVLGDAFNDFGVARVEVIAFWDYWLKEAAKVTTVYVITGNHDMNSECTETALIAYESIQNVHIVMPGKYLELQMTNKEIIFLLPFYRHNEDFIKAVNEAKALGATYVICHQEFNGAQFETGMYTPHGVKLEELPKGIKFISGHIHKEQQINDGQEVKVLYPGTPRQLTRADIGEVKGVTLWNEATGIFEKIPTPKEVCEPFSYIVIDENNPNPTIEPSQRTYVDIKGSAEFIKKAMKKLPDEVKVRTFPENESTAIAVKESHGIPAAFAAWWWLYKVSDKDKKAEALRILYEKCPVLKGVTNGNL